MKNLIKITTILFLFIQTIGYSQTKSTETTSKEQTSKVDTEQLKNFVGKFLLEEGNFTLEIVQEENKMFIISPYSKDLLVQKNKTTLLEPTRGVNLSLITDNKNALKFTQNGYETIIKRVADKTGK